MILITGYDYADKIGKARVTVMSKIRYFDIKPVGSLMVGTNKRPSHLYDIDNLNTLIFTSKAGRPRKNKE